MNILQASAAIIRNGQSKIILVQAVPLCRQILDIKITGNHGALQFKANHDMHVVGGFVRINANEARLHHVGRLIDLLCRESIGCLAEVLRHLLLCPCAELLAAPHLILPEAALAFMDRKTDGLAHGGGDPILIKPLLIHSVSSFMHGASKTVKHAVSGVTARHAHVAAMATPAEWMRTAIKSAAVKVESNGTADKPRKAFLGVNVHRVRVE